MCTVTYLPKANRHFLLTHNRDEHYTRAIATFPQAKILGNQKVLYPTDKKAGGTWIATSLHYTLCILNGGFQKHIYTPPYKHSRGKIIIDFFEFQNPELFLQNYNVYNIEPFTLIIIEHHQNKIHQLVFDGIQKHHSFKDYSLPHIWSSSTLYDEKSRKIRETYFTRFVNQNQFNQKDIIQFHENKFEKYDTEGIQINRNNILKTVSLTSIKKEAHIEMYYKDFFENKTETFAL